MRHSLVLTGFFLVAMHGGCGTFPSRGGSTESNPSQAPPMKSGPASLRGTTWVLKGFGLRGPVQTLIFDPSNRVSGFAGVNRFSGRAVLTGKTFGSVEFSPLVSTKVGGSPEANQSEMRFFEMLAAARFWRLTVDGLYLSSNAGEALHFVPAAQ